VVRYLWWKAMPLVFAELDGKPSARTAAILDLFTRAGLPAHTISNVEAAQKTHAAGLPGFAGAAYAAGGVRQLAHSPHLIRMFVAAYREALRGLRADGTPITPASNRLVEWIPQPLLVFTLRFLLNTRLAVVGGERHAMAAPDEMKEVADEIQAILDRTHTPSPASSAMNHEIGRTTRQPSPACPFRGQVGGCAMLNTLAGTPDSHLTHFVGGARRTGGGSATAKSRQRRRWEQRQVAGGPGERVGAK
jgi:hypothetical protein